MTMVTLNTRTTNGSLAWNKYILNNDGYKSLELDVVSSTYILSKSGSKELQLYPDDKIGILETNELQEVLNVPRKNKFGLCYFAFTNSGYTSIYYVRKPTKTDVLNAEKIAIKNLDESIKSFGRPISLVVSGETYDGIIGCRNVNGTPKADFALYDIHGNDIVFISHKKSGGSKSFQQYSGISRKSRLDIEDEVVDFLADVDSIITENGGKLPSAIYRYIQSEELINKALFGPDYGNQYGVDNCQIVAQGLPYIDVCDVDVFELNWSDHVISNGELSSIIGEYLPIIGVTFRTGRKIDTKFGPIYNVRGGIYPLGCLSSRKNSMVI
jgi:hypothetical protein